MLDSGGKCLVLKKITTWLKEYRKEVIKCVIQLLNKCYLLGEDATEYPPNVETRGMNKRNL